jgi:hypothetical protein
MSSCQRYGADGQFSKAVNLLEKPLVITFLYGFEKFEHYYYLWKEGDAAGQRSLMPLPLEKLAMIAKNDGLSIEDFHNWFKIGFEGQLIGFSSEDPYKDWF